MALEATHIRFALDLKDTYDVKDIQQYVFGTTYPDTRVLTKTPREFTHPSDFQGWNIPELSDFKKGWSVHLLCDKVQGQIFKQEFPEIFTDKTIEHGNDSWVAITAIKALQDMEDLQQIDLSLFWENLALVENPNKENIDELNYFYIQNRNFYANPHELTLKDYYTKLVNSGVNPDIASQVLHKALSYRDDIHIMNVVKTIYSKMLSEVTK